MSDEIQEKMEALSVAYSVQLPNRVQEIELGWARVKQYGDQDALAILARNAHDLCGTAGTYGYTLVSDVSYKLGEYFSNLAYKDLTPAIELEIEKLIQDLAQLVLKAPEKNIMPTFFLPQKSKNENRCIYVLDKKKEKLVTALEELKQFNYDVKIFTETSEFLESVNIDKPDMIIMDVNFSKNISPQHLQQLREELILLVFMADEDELMSRLFAVRQGGQAFFVKPLEINTLLRMLDNLFETRHFQNDRVLIVDDSEFLANYYSVLLNNFGMMTEVVVDPRKFLIKLQKFQPDLILMDVHIPYCSGTELAKIVYQQENLTGIPVIFLSSSAEKAKELDVLSYIGDDFLIKPIDPRYLLAMVRNRLMRSRMLKSRVMRDSLTNLYNHSMIHHHLQREILIAERYQREVSIALLDIDNFKSVNEKYGHQTGDKILKELSSFLETKLRKVDSIGRYSGQAFLIVLPNTDAKSAMMLINSLREEFAATARSGEQTYKKFFVTFSAGIASFPKFKKATELITAANQALSQAKEQGRNRVVE